MTTVYEPVQNEPGAKETVHEPQPGYERLLEPGLIGHMGCRNRIVMAPMGTNYAAEDGRITARIKDYYEERARGGAGLIVVGIGSVDHSRGRVIRSQVGIADDRFIPGLSELAQVVQRHGARIAIQLHHGGKISTQDLAEGHAPAAASAASLLMNEAIAGLTAEEVNRLMQRFARMPADGMAREVTREEIGRIVRFFADAAERARKAGIDGVEIHAGHGYLISGFLSSFSNRRKDEYGGKLENRARILLEIIRAVRAKVGAAYPVWCRLDGREFGVEEGITPEEAQELARMVEAAGLDAIHVSGYGGPGLGGFYEGPLVYPPGNLVPLAEGIRKAVNIPVIAVGRISPEMGEDLLRQGKADFIAMGRPLLADPELPNKLASGGSKDIRPCICCYACVARIFWDESVHCTVNPAAGKESKFRIEEVGRAKKILVVGGGPAGMEAARIAALRGHEVTLHEQEDYLGGQFHIASLPPHKQDISPYLDCLEGQLQKSGVEVVLGRAVTASDVAEMRPEAVVVATGGRPHAPNIPGIHGHNMVTARDVLAGKAAAGNWVLVAGGGLVGCETADFLAARGAHVTIVEMLPEVASDMVIWPRQLLLQRLQRGRVHIRTSTRILEFTADGAVVEHDGHRHTISGMDSIVLALGMTTANDLADAIRDIVPEIHVIGDARCCGNARDAIAAGAMAGAMI